MRLLFIGRPTIAKGLPDLLEALTLLPQYDWELHLVGVFQSIGNAKIADSQKLMPRCRILGPKPNSEIPGIMRSSDAVVIPSRYENFCNVALEAMAAGRAIIGARCGGIPSLVEDGRTGLLFEAGSSEDLATKLEKVFKNPTVLTKMGENAWHKSRNYDWERICSLTHDLFIELATSELELSKD